MTSITTQAVTVTSNQKNYNLVMGEVILPPLGDHDVRIQVVASGINRADIYQSQGSYPPPKGASDILGLEVSGVIAEIGPEVRAHAVGDKVCALLSGGGYASEVNVPEWRVLPVPTGMDVLTAASLPEAYATIYRNIMEIGKLRPLQTVLVHGGGSGIGTAAIQLIKAFGASVVVTAGSDAKCQRCLTLGADVAINYREDNFVTAVKEYTQGRGCDLVLDIVGGDYIEQNFRALARFGTMISISFIHGARAEVDFSGLLMKNLTLTGSTLRSQEEKVIHELMQSLRTVVWPMIEAEKIVPTIDKIFPASQADKAHACMRDSQHFGKILLEW